jgi:DNA processing protein
VVTGASIGCECTVAKTVAKEGGDLILVTLGGPDVDYPEESKDALDYARKHGLVVSAVPPTTPPMPGKVPARRHVLAAICSTMLVTEAALMSNAASAARIAMEYERDVHTVPGSIFSSESLGTNNLAKEGAMLVTCEHDLVLMLEKLRTGASSTGRRTICEILEDGPATTAKLRQETECGTSELLSALARLEMDGIVNALPDGRWALEHRRMALTCVAKPNWS